MHFTRDLAVARFATVVLIELLALVICFLPLARGSEQWQIDCRKLGIVAAILALVVCVLGFTLAGLAPRPSADTKVISLLELGVATIYLFNVGILALVAARTNGPTTSLYGTLIPIQLSAILFLQLHKEKLSADSSPKVARFYVVIGLLGFLLAHYLREQILTWQIFTTDSRVVDYAKENADWAAWLTVGAMLLSFATYAIPTNDRVVSKIRSWYASESQ